MRGVLLLWRRSVAASIYCLALLSILSLAALAGFRIFRRAALLGTLGASCGRRSLTVLGHTKHAGEDADYTADRAGSDEVRRVIEVLAFGGDGERVRA